MKAVNGMSRDNIKIDITLDFPFSCMTVHSRSGRDFWSTLMLENIIMSAIAATLWIFEILHEFAIWRGGDNPSLCISSSDGNHLIFLGECVAAVATDSIGATSWFPNSMEAKLWQCQNSIGGSGEMQTCH